MRYELVAFGAALVALWAAMSAPAFWIAGTAGVRGSAVAALVCGIPAMGTLAFYLWTSTRSTNWQLAAVLGGMFARMAIALGVGLGLYYGVEGFTLRSFLSWLMLYYCASLFVEVGFVVRKLNQSRTKNVGRS